MKPILRLSQGHLNLLSTCPRKFQHTYLDQLKSPIDPDLQARLEWGNRFHLLMQQRELGLPVESLLAEDEQLKHSFYALLNAAPDLFTPKTVTWREAEHCRTLEFQGYLITVVYDLLIADTQTAKIFDWKTYPQPENQKKIASNWQTRLYLFVLAETSQYLPENLSFTYWFVKLPTQPQKLPFNYNNPQHEKTKEDLSNLLNQLDAWWEDYQQRGIPFPQTNHEQHCQNCSFATRCDRNSEQQPELPSLAEIEEVVL